MRGVLNSLLDIYQQHRQLLLFALAAVVVIVFINATQQRGHSFYGIAGNSEIKISSQYPVKIKTIQVIPGQSVKRGDKLVELIRDDLELKAKTILDKLAILKAKLGHNQRLMEMIDGNQKSRKNGRADANAPAILEMRALENQLRMIEGEKSKLVIYSEIDGIVGDVFFHQGEKVSPFSTILSLGIEKANYIEAWIHEKNYTLADLNQSVSVSSLVDRTREVKGEIVNVGKRIVQFPTRLVRHQGAAVWGRKVLVKLPANNSFLLGEKVFVSIGIGGQGLFEVAADTGEDKEDAAK
jgi:multidrug resistance efflux pump